MMNEFPGQTMPTGPAPEGFASWPDIWTARGMPWRTKPEIDEARQRFLAERRAVKPDIERGIYPFRDENGGITLTRADVEWLLATHESGGIRGPVDWQDALHHKRKGLDLRGADLHEEDLSHLPLAHMCGGLAGEDYNRAFPHPELLNMAAVHLEGTNLSYAHLEGAFLNHAYLAGANLSDAKLNATELVAAHLEAKEPADLSFCVFDKATRLWRLTVANHDHVGPRLRGVQWGGVSVAEVDWSSVWTLEDERRARAWVSDEGVRQRPSASPLRAWQRAVQSNRQLAILLRGQGLNEDADRFAYRAQILQQQVLRRQGMRKWPALFASLMLDLLAGYGYRPVRSFLVYLIAIIWFANVYHFLALPSLDAVVFSMASFHGRGFFPSEAFTLHSPVAIISAIEAFWGLLIEIIFIATFTQRFFAR